MGLGFGGLDVRFGVRGSKRSGANAWNVRLRVWVVGFRVEGLEISVSRSGLGISVWGFGFWVSGFVIRDKGSGMRVRV